MTEINLDAEARHRIDHDELHTALEGLLGVHFGARRRIKRLRRRLSAYSSSYTIENLELDLDRNQRLRLVLKDLSPAALLQTAQLVRPHFLYEPRREIETYRHVLAPARLGTPVFYGALADPGLERYWLFLERVTGPLLWQMGRLDPWCDAARWLAGFHSQFAAHRDNANHATRAHLLTYDAEFYCVWLTRAESFLRHKHVDRSPQIWRRFARLASRYDRLLTRLLAFPSTVVHGEFYPSNVLMRPGRGPRRICPVDWEVAATAPGLIDMAALTSGNWTDDQKKQLVAAHREALAPARGWPPALNELVEAVECCQLHQAVQLLGWAADWSPPEKHAQNWLREAFRLGEKLGVL